MTTKLEALMGRLLDYVQATYDRDVDMLEPVWVMQDAAGTTTAVVSPLHDDGHKDSLAKVIRGLLTQHQAVRYVFASEVWVNAAHTEEAVMVIGVDRGGEKRGRRYRIDRTGITPQLLGGEPTEILGGRFTDLFENPST